MFGWFGRKSAPERQPFVPAWLTGEAEQGGFARGYEAQLEEVYRRNPVGLRAVRLVAGLVGGLPLYAEGGDAKAVSLVRAGGLMERAAANLLLHGNAYVRLAVDGHDRPAELHLMRPERVSVACGADGWPSAYLYRAGGQVTRVAREDALGRRQVADPTQILLNADDDALMAGANLALLGEELVQFGRAELLAPGLYRLSRLLRGRRATEWAASTHSAGEALCLIDRSVLRSIELQPSAVGAPIMATAHGIGDVAPLPTAQRLISGEAMRPPSPCHLKLWREGSSVRAEWVRRSHRIWAWVDGVGDAADAFPELYRLTVSGPSGTIQSDVPDRSMSWVLSELPGVPGQLINLSVVTVGPLALSCAATASLSL